MISICLDRLAMIADAGTSSPALPPQNVMPFGAAIIVSLALLVAAISLAGCFAFYRRKVVQPLRLLRESVRRMGNEGDSSRRLQVAGSRDVALLTAEINAMLASLESARHSVEAANRAKGEFLANMSREIHAPMSAILGFAEELLAEPGWEFAPPVRHNAVRTIRRNGEHLLDFVNDMLDLSKIEAGELRLSPTPTSPLNVVAEVASMMKVRADAKRLALVAKFDGPMPDQMVLDRARMRQILVNLVENAIHSTDRGGVEIVVRMLDRESTQPRICFDVIDTGIGLARDQLETLFQPFRPAGESTTRPNDARLRLAISKRLAQLMGGDITVANQPNGGAKFSIALNAALDDETNWIDDPARALAEIMRVDRPPSDQPTNIAIAGRVLLAEDSHDAQRLIGHLLRRAGADLTVVENGQRAYETARLAEAAARPFHVIVMEMQLPVLDGYTATRQLRDSGYRGAIIGLSANATADDRQRCITAGCDDYATRPINRRALLETVAQYCAVAIRPSLAETAMLL